MGGMLDMPVSCGGVIGNLGDVVTAVDPGVLILPPEEAERAADEAVARQEKGLVNQAQVAVDEQLDEMSGAALTVVEATNV